MTIKPLGPNQTQLHTDKGIIFFSYETPVGAVIDGDYFRTSKKWSNTTSRHINNWLNGRNAEEKEQSFFDSLASWHSKNFQYNYNMKVTFQLSKSDIQNIVAEKFGLAVSEVELVIKVGLGAFMDNAFNRIEALMKAGQKIAAIRELRIAAPQWGSSSSMGLREAKDAIEDWANYRNACEIKGELILEWVKKF